VLSLVAMPGTGLPEGGTLSLAATVEPAEATGTVMFARSAASTGPWTNLGSLPLTGGKATKSWQAMSGAWWFRASYSGSGTHAASSAVTGPVTVAPAAAPVEQVLVVTGSWTARYGGDGSLLAAPGASQGVLDLTVDGDPDPAGNGHERALVGFDTSGLPAGADVLQVRLQTRWDSWLYPSGLGVLLLGWHTEDTAPDAWLVDAPWSGRVGLSEHDIEVGAVDLVLDWAAPAVASAAFGGLAIGPGENDGGLYAGSTAAAPEDWVLVIRYQGSS
jgi:hypothetical protein